MKLIYSNSLRAIRIIYILLSVILIMGNNFVWANGAAGSEFELEQEHYEEDEIGAQVKPVVPVLLQLPVQPPATKSKPLMLQTPREVSMSSAVNAAREEDFEREDYAHEAEKEAETDSERVKKFDNKLANSAPKEGGENLLSGFYVRFGAGSQKGVSSQRLAPFNINNMPTAYPFNAINVENPKTGPNPVIFQALTADIPASSSANYPQTYDGVTNQETSRVLGAAVGYSFNDFIELELSGESYHYSYHSGTPLVAQFTNPFMESLWSMAVNLRSKYSIDVSTYMLSANLKIPLDSSFKPFVIGGVGFARVKETSNLSADKNSVAGCQAGEYAVQGPCQTYNNYYIPGYPVVQTQVVNYFNQTVTASKRIPMFQVGVGLEYDFNEKVAADLRYKYNRSLKKTPMANLTLQNHNFTIGIKYKF